MSNSQRERELYNEINCLINIEGIMHILDSSDFFKDKYLKQTFLTTNRFKIDKIHGIKGVPLKKFHEKRLIKERKNTIEFSSYIESVTLIILFRALRCYLKIFIFLFNYFMLFFHSNLFIFF
jgi:hypothetical protein